MEHDEKRGGQRTVEAEIDSRLEWEVNEFVRYERGALWYTISILVGLGLLVYAILTANFLFALIIVMFALALYLSIITEPAKIRFALTDGGIEIGRSRYPYHEIKSFWLIYDPPEVKKLYLDFRTPLRPRLTIDLDDVNPNDVRSALMARVHEDLTQVEEPMTEILGRLFKI